MSFFSILIALLIEQARPLGRGNWVHASMRAWVRGVIRQCDTGRKPHGWLVWGLAVGVPSLVALLVYWLLLALVGWPLAMLWNVAVLYETLGFRQFSHHFTDIRKALDAGDEDTARRLLAEWQQIDASELPSTEIIRQVIEHSVLAAHRHVFGVLTWFCLGAALGLGPAGAVVYRLAEFVTRYWHHLAARRSFPVSAVALSAASRAWYRTDWLPARITAFGFALVGSFEEAIDSWRKHSTRQPDDNDGVILAATAGAVNVRLQAATTPTQAATPEEESTPIPSRPAPELAHLRSTVGLVWRSVVMWMLLLALLTLARLVG